MNKIYFKNFITLQRGFDLPASLRKEGDVPVVASTSITGYHNEYKVKSPGVVTGRSGALGEVQFVNKNFFPLNTTLWVKDFKNNNPKYVYYFLKTLDLRRFNSGAGVPTLNRNDLNNLEIKIHDPDNQKKVASILSSYDNLIENNTRRIEIFEELIRRIYEEWFVKFRFPRHEQIKMVESEFGPIPQDWSAKHLEDIAQEIRETVDPNEVDPLTPYVGLEHIPRRSIALSEWGKAKDVQSTKHIFKSGNILFGKIRPYFHKVSVAPINGVCSSDAIVIEAKDNEMFPFVLGTVSSDDFVKYATQTSNGVKMPRANWAVLLKYPVFIPSDNLKKRFSNFIKPTLEQIKILTFKVRNLRKTRDLLLPKLISGEVDVSHFPEPETI